LDAACRIEGVVTFPPSAFILPPLGWRTLAKHLGMSRGNIENRLALLAQPDDVQAMGWTAPDTLMHAPLIGSLPVEQREPLITQVVEDKLP
jgi:hypothetical protein